MALTQVPASMQESNAQYTGFKNRIINGAMMIDQRNAGASVTTADAFTLDRWHILNSSAGTVSTQRVASAPSGFRYSTKLTVGTADASVAAGDSVVFFQPIEGYNIADLGFGTASPSAVTVSFWVNSSLTGTYTGSIVSISGGRSYPYTYTVNAANTWEQKTVTFTADSSGTWDYTNDVGLYLEFSLMCGSSVQGTANTWQAGNFRGTSSQVNWMATSGATFYITGVQLEKGSTATSFDYRPYGTELALCQRYFARFNSLGGSYRGVGAGVSESATSISCVVKYPVSMRSGPTASGANMATYDGSSVRAITAFSTQYTGSDGLNINLTVGGGGMTTNRPANLISDNSGTGYFDLSAEL